MVQRLFTGNYVQKKTKPQILVIHRSDAKDSARMVSNHDEMITALAGEFPQCDVRVFVGAEHKFEEVVQMWGEADVVVGPHGAALTFLPFLRPGRAVGDPHPTHTPALQTPTTLPPAPLHAGG